MELTVDTATAIITEAKAHDVYSGELPEDDGVRVAEAERLVQLALDAHKAGAKGDAIMTIINIVEASTTPEASPEPEEIKASEPEPVQPSTPPQPNRFDEAIQAKELALARIAKENLPIPPNIEGEPPVLPRDLTALSDLELRQLYSDFNACGARANWDVALLDADEDAAKSIAEHMFNKVMEGIDRLDHTTQKPKVIPVLEAEANRHPDVKVWRDRHLEIRSALRFFKALRDTYNNNCERISREFTMRIEERSNS